jgi:hypothetical protein
VRLLCQVAARLKRIRGEKGGERGGCEKSKCSCSIQESDARDKCKKSCGFSTSASLEQRTWYLQASMAYFSTSSLAALCSHSSVNCLRASSNCTHSTTSTKPHATNAHMNLPVQIPAHASLFSNRACEHHHSSCPPDPSLFGSDPERSP